MKKEIAMMELCQLDTNSCSSILAIGWVSKVVLPVSCGVFDNSSVFHYLLIFSFFLFLSIQGSETTEEEEDEKLVDTSGE